MWHLNDLKDGLEVWKGVLESKGLRVNVKKTKMMSNGVNARKSSIEGEFPCAVCGKSVGSNSILC